MATYETPGVYVEEISTLPPSVAGVATAIPAFIGTTVNHPGAPPAQGEEETQRPPPVIVEEVTSLLEFEQKFGKTTATAFTADADTGAIAPVDPMPVRLLWYAMAHYFRNGGARCYVLAVNDHTGNLDAADFMRGLTRLAEIDEPTLIVMPELVGLDQDDFDATCQEALSQCNNLMDRFALLDVRQDSSRTRSEDISTARSGYGGNNLSYGAAYYPYLKTVLTHHYEESGVTVGTGTLASIKGSNTALYNLIKRNLASQRVVLPASAAMAGICVRVDRERGVWKAPANEGVAATIAPTVELSREQQKLLNVDATSGKSINAIRSFAGRGILVWGARTLAGNDNEWRYISVRRLFIMIEESTKKASAFAVFEPNDATTWLKVKGMIESYLYGLWEQGALQGSTPNTAYFVKVGLGSTMSSQDVLEGRMIVEIGVAAVRPAEFIILRFSHMTAQA